MSKMFFARRWALIALAAVLGWQTAATGLLPQSAQAQHETPAEAPAADHDHAAGAPHGEADAAAHGESHAAEHGPQSPIEWKNDLALWSLVTFVLFVFVLGKFAWRPLMDGLHTRESKIRQDIENAESARVRAEQMLREHTQRLEKVQDEIREILAEARRDAEHTRQEIISAAEREAQASKQRAIVEIQRVRDQALDELFSFMASTVTSATEHVLGRSLTDADHQRLISEALNEFKSKGAALSAEGLVAR